MKVPREAEFPTRSTLARAPCRWSCWWATPTKRDKNIPMERIALLLAGALLLGLSAAAVVAADPMQDPKGDLPGAGTEDQSKPDDEPAECPIKKTIDGKTYCFQNDPALTKPQGGD